MKVALSWLKKYLDIPESVSELSDLLTFAGIEVEDVKELKALPASVIAARVVSAEPVPKTDHLQLCQVDVGEYPFAQKGEDNCVQVICGAPNCHSGMIAVLALPGSILTDLEIKSAKIRGIISNGMLCSERELGISDSHAGIIELPQDVLVGTSVNEFYMLPDVVFDLEITPNRSDLLGYLGIARDLGAKLNRKLIEPELTELSVNFDRLKLGLKNMEPELCPRYTAQVFDNVQIAESPLWLKVALIKSGLRPINNVVDITNYVMLETGHPLHAFDYDKLASEDTNASHPDIVIRKARPKEEMLALDGRSYILEGDELVIADGQKASAIAGVMGSEFSGITPQSRRIVLESAAFHPGSIRKTSYKLKLSSDSSYRFERHLAADKAHLISQRASNLIQELAGGELCGPLYDEYPNPLPDQYLAIRPSRFQLLIGHSLSDAEIQAYLSCLSFEFKGYGRYQKGLQSSLEQLLVNDASVLPSQEYAHYYLVPSFRVDVSREADILEELARLSGYDKVPQKLVNQQIMDRHAYRIRNKIMDWMVNWGCYETLNYSFCDPRQMEDLGYEPQSLPFINLINPQSSNQSVMRVSLIPQLITNLAYNLNHAERNVKLFEQAKVYHKTETGHQEPMQMAAIFSGMRSAEHWQSKAQTIDFSWVKGCLESMLGSLNLPHTSRSCERPYLVTAESRAYFSEDTELGVFGRLKPELLAKWGIDLSILKQDVWIIECNVDAIVAKTRSVSITYQPISRFPAVLRDLSFLAPLQVQYQDIREQILAIDPALVQEIEVFDEYRSKQIPEGFRSLSMHIILQDQEKTLTDERVDQLMDLVQKTLTDKYDIRMR